MNIIGLSRPSLIFISFISFGIVRHVDEHGETEERFVRDSLSVVFDMERSEMSDFSRGLRYRRTVYLCSWFRENALYAITVQFLSV
uniref:Uncharacterized protein n=1 Tax=Anguilla anguilla TaxID=7936 RepID=A0A0E9SFX7_ANGAN